MFSKFERMVALRYLRARRKEGFISVVTGFSFLGITLGVATLIVVMAVMNGFRAELMDRILGINAHISINKYGVPIENYSDLSEKIKSIDGVKQATPVVYGEVLSTAHDRHVGSVVRGLSFEDLKAKKLISENIVIGSIDVFDKGGVIIGSRMARNLRLVPGSVIRLISPKTTETFIGAMPRIKDYQVAAIFEVGMFEYDNSTIFMPIDAAQVYFRAENAATSIEVDIGDPNMVDVMTAKISKVLSDDYSIVDWQESNSHFLNSLKVERNVMFLILTLIILVAAFNIISGMVMLVTSKGKEIAIIRTIGATKTSIMKIFLICGSAIGVTGTFFGFLLGLGFAKNIETIRKWLEQVTDTNLFAEEVYFLSKLPADVQMGDVINVVILSLALSLLATIYPAWRAARIAPAEGLRYE